MRLALAAALVVTAATAASARAADTVARSDVGAGPVLAGDTVVWANTTLAGKSRIFAARPGRRPAVGHRFPRRERSGRTDRSHGVEALSASGGRVAALVDTCWTGRGRSLYTDACIYRAFGGPRAGRLRALGRPLPRRPPPFCPRRRHRQPISIAVAGPWTAVAEERTCRSTIGGPDEDHALGLPGGAGESAFASAARSRLVVHRAGRSRVLPTSGASDLRLAGRYLAWREPGGARGSRIVLYDLRLGTRVRRVESSPRAGVVYAFDVQADGTLAYVRRREHDLCVEYLRLGDEAEPLGCSASHEDIALAGGRVLYRRVSGYEVVLEAPGSPPVVLQSSETRRRPTGDLDLSPSAATWAFQPMEPGMERRESGRPKVVVHRLGP